MQYGEMECHLSDAVNFGACLCRKLFVLFCDELFR